MIGETFQLAGAILTVYSVISLNNKAVLESSRNAMVYSGERIEKLIERYADRNYAFTGIILVVIGYILPIINVDMDTITNVFIRISIFILLVLILVVVGIVTSKTIAKYHFKKEYPNV